MHTNATMALNSLEARLAPNTQHLCHAKLQQKVCRMQFLITNFTTSPNKSNSCITSTHNASFCLITHQLPYFLWWLYIFLQQLLYIANYIYKLHITIFDGYNTSRKPTYLRCIYNNNCKSTA